MTKNLLQQIMLKPIEKKSFINEQDLIEKIQSGYTVDLASKHMQKKTFAPSTLVYGHGECPRYWYLAFEGNIFEDNNTAYGVANMTSGTMSHDRIQQAMLDSGVAVEYFDDDGKPTTEFKVLSNDPPIFGWGDAMLTLDGEDVIGEIKTMNQDVFDHYKFKGEPKKGHLIQLLIYMKVLKKAKGVLIYENKNNHDLIAFPIEVTPYYKEWIETTFEWMRTVRKAWTDKTFPQKNYRSNSKICKNCPLKAVCDKSEAGVIKIPSLEGLSETV